MSQICDYIHTLPLEMQKEIYLYVFKKCDICFKKVEFWNVYDMKDIYHVRMENYSFTFVYLFLNNDKKLCGHCYSMIKHWFR